MLPPVRPRLLPVTSHIFAGTLITLPRDPYQRRTAYATRWVRLTRAAATVTVACSRVVQFPEGCAPLKGGWERKGALPVASPPLNRGGTFTWMTRLTRTFLCSAAAGLWHCAFLCVVPSRGECLLMEGRIIPPLSLP